jgi:hypothetical protein
MDRLDEIKALHELLRAGHLTQDEFDEQKRLLLSQEEPPKEQTPTEQTPTEQTPKESVPVESKYETNNEDDHFSDSYPSSSGSKIVVSMVAILGLACVLGYFILNQNPNGDEGSESASERGAASTPETPKTEAATQAPSAAGRQASKQPRTNNDQVGSTPVPTPQAAIRKTLERWTATQRTVDFSGYASLYSRSGFVGIKRTKSGEIKRYDYSGWLRDRKTMFKPGLVVHVRDHNFLEIGSQNARVRVTQYWQSSSGRYADRGPKEFTLTKENGSWRITSEDMLSSQKWDGRLPD